MAETRWYHLTGDEALRELGRDPCGAQPCGGGCPAAAVRPEHAPGGEGGEPLAHSLAQFKNFLILLLIGATGLSLLLGHTLDAIVIFSIVIVSALLGFYQEFRAERAMQALKAMASPTASVVRAANRSRSPPPTSSRAMCAFSTRGSGAGGRPAPGGRTCGSTRPRSPANRRRWRRILVYGSPSRPAWATGATWCSPERW